MNIMVLDAEYNQPSQMPIQIGAAVFNARTGQMLESIEFYVNPGEPLHPEIIELCGITDQDVLGGVSPLEAYQELERLHKKWKCFRNPLVWGSGVSNDSQTIYLKSGAEGENFMGFRVLDVKTLYQSMQVYKNKQFAGSLETVCERLGLGFEGKPHRALSDAINTFRVWFYLVKRLANEQS